MKRDLLIAIIVMLFPLLVFDCAKKPKKELQEAVAAVDSAKMMEVDQWVGDYLKEAVDSLNRGKELIEAKDYESAKKTLRMATDLARKGMQKAQQVKKLAAEQEKAARERQKKLAEEKRKKEEAAQKAAEEKKKKEAAERAKRMQTRQYTVKKGDCLWNIAKREYGNPMYWNNIYKNNKDKIDNYNLIYPGQVLTLPPMEKEKAVKAVKAKPPSSGKTYTVVKGDCLWSIAQQQYGNPLLWKQIYEQNNDIIENPDMIFPDQILDIPPKP